MFYIPIDIVDCSGHAVGQIEIRRLLIELGKFSTQLNQHAI